MNPEENKHRNMVWCLLRRNISTGQLAGYAVATFVGLAILSVALQFYRDVISLWHDEDKLFGENYIVVSKKVSGFGGLFGSNSSAFSADEISDIARQPWSRKVGAFTAADFNVNASASLGGGRLSTSLFLETIPDEFFDITPREWDYDPQRGGIVPIIIPKDYLALYNFGYAASHGMPQLSESMIGMLPLKLSLSGNGDEATVDARIVGFSSRLNTIAVPEAFLEEANRRFGSKPETAQSPSRLIVKVSDKADPAIRSYLSDKGYEQGGDVSQSGQLTFFLRLTTSVVVAIGVVITLLSFFILVLSIYLLLQKNRRKIHDLMLLGYFPEDISKAYVRMVTVINAGVVCLSAAVVFIAQMLWTSQLELMQASPSSLWLTFTAMVGIMAVLTILSMVIIRRRVCATFRLS
ncbi:MAG: hypothetical protein C7K11_00970 [Candidatus Amulumruptor caecigallinarius]|uniref:ABC transporter permease n=1 Tax=Candidatus Amulumruptor caecigallinarius TaxID=2109911 RepID=A0A4Q0UAV6_9BACT|nr:MAG: hypothetical protein C7K11_00970 [Candidatus Amulumruptor caecigallinarius]HJE39464.1 ABC transporter permease [Candidatus Amulumruptor caecigallinarius]